MVTCPNCGNQASEGAIFCDQCGARLPVSEPVPGPESAQAPQAVPAPVAEAGSSPQAAPAPGGGSVICPACGAGNVPGEAFCDYCGSPLDAPVPTAAPVAEAEPVAAEAAPVAAEAAPAGAGAPAAEGGLTCPACGAPVEPGEAFCQNCGASLAQPPLPPEAVEEPAVAEAPAAVEEPPAPAEALAAAIEEPAPPVEEPIEQAAPAPVIPPAAPMPAPPDAGVAAALNCPACGAEISPDDTFCSSCGFALKAAPAPAPGAVPATPPVLGGPRLVVSATGAEIPLPAKSEIVVGREDPVSGIYPDVDLTPHGGEEGGVSRRHARIVADGGNYYVVDLDSTNFTFVNKQKLTPGTQQQVQPGEEIRFGRVAVVFQS